MNDLRKLIEDIASLTAIQRTELAALLDEKRSAQGNARTIGPSLAPSHQNLRILEAEDWLTAEALSLEQEAGDLARSLDETLDYERARCDAVRKDA